MDLKDFQTEMGRRFGGLDKESGPFFLMTVLTVEVGELAEAVKNEDKTGIEEELADLVFAAVSMANLYDLDLAGILKKKYLDKKTLEIARSWDEPHIKKRKRILEE